MNPVIVANTIIQLWKFESIADKNFTNFVRDILKSRLNIKSSIIYMALYYIHQLSQRLSAKRQQFSEYRIFVTSLILAESFNNDAVHSISTWSRICGMQKDEIIAMRIEFLNVLDYQLFISELNYKKWTLSLNLMISLKKEPYEFIHYIKQLLKMSQHWTQLASRENNCLLMKDNKQLSLLPEWRV